MAVVPKRGLAIPILPFHFGSSRSSIPFGRSASATSLVLTIRTRARAANPYQVPSLARKVAGRSAAWDGRNGASSPFSLRRKRVEDLVVPEQVAPGPGGLGGDQVRQADGLGALDVELGQDRDPGPFRVRVQDRLGELAVERRVDDDRPGPVGGDREGCVMAASATSRAIRGKVCRIKGLRRCGGSGEGAPVVES